MSLRRPWSPLLVGSWLLVGAVLTGKAPATEAAKRPLRENIEDSARYAWEHKPILERRLIDDAEDARTWSHNDFGSMTFTRERSRDGLQSVRLQSKTKGERATKDNRPWGYCSAIRTVAGEDWTHWNRLALWIYPDFPGHKTVSVYIVVNNDGGKKRSRDNIILKNQEWNYIVSEIEFLPRDHVTSVEIKGRLSGNEPGASESFTYDIDQLELQRVAPDYYRGWSVAPDHIAFSHTGYEIGAAKTAIASNLTAKEFQVIDEATQRVVLSRQMTAVDTYRGHFQLLDFSELDAPGDYSLQAGGARTRPFRIGRNVWQRPIEKVLNFFYTLRCGFAVPGVHDASHLDWRATGGGRSVSLTGGWYDAGDLSQGLQRTAEASAAMFRLVERMGPRGENPELARELLAEATWGLDWVLQTTLHDGKRPIWAVQGWWTNGIVGDSDDTHAQFGGSAAAFMSAATTEAIGYRMLLPHDPVRAALSLKTAEEDWGFGVEYLTRDMARSPTCMAVSETVLASLELFRVTHQQKYADQALALESVLTAAQERRFVSGSKPGLCGFLYTDPTRRHILHSVTGNGAYEHTQILALAALCEDFPDHPRWMEWYSAVAMYCEFLKQGAQNTAPYLMLPAGVYQENEESGPGEWTGDRFHQQLLAGQRVGDRHVLRALPANDGHFGQLHLQLSQAKALAVGAHLRGDLDGVRLAKMQLEWMVGRNPMCRSFMYGEGYDYLPLYSPMCGPIVGALPVGLPTFGAVDEPYWPAGSNEPSPREQWVQTAARFLALSADVLGPTQLQGSAGSVVRVKSLAAFRDQDTAIEADDGFNMALAPGRYRVNADGVEHKVFALPASSVRIDRRLAYSVSHLRLPDGGISVQAEISGVGAHAFTLRTSNVKIDQPTRWVTLQPGEVYRLTWAGKVVDPASPLFVVVVPDQDLSQRKEATLAVER